MNDQTDQKPETEKVCINVPALKWKPADIDPDMDKLMELSKNFVRSRRVLSKGPEVEFFRSLNMERINEWDEQADKILAFYQQLKENIVFIRAVHIAYTFFDYLEDIWKHNKNRKPGEPRLEAGYDLILIRGQHGISASWRRSKFVTTTDAKVYRAQKHLRIGNNDRYNKTTFFCASNSVRDFIYYSIECNLAVLRKQTEDLGNLAKAIRQYNSHGTDLFQDHRNK